MLTLRANVKLDIYPQFKIIINLSATTKFHCKDINIQTIDIGTQKGEKGIVISPQTENKGLINSNITIFS